MCIQRVPHGFIPLVMAELVVFQEFSSGWIQDGQSLTQESKMAYLGGGH
jgi:hypothetical protein